MQEEVDDEVVDGLENDPAGNRRGGLWEGLKRRSRERKKKLEQAKKLEKAVSRGASVAKLLAIIGAWLASGGWIFVLIALTFLSLYLAFHGFIQSIWCQVTPSPCGRNALVQLSDRSSLDNSLQGRVLALASGQLDPKSIRSLLDEVDKTTDQMVVQAEKSQSPNLAKLKSIKSAVDSQIAALKPLVKDDDQLVGEEITRVRSGLQELARTLGQLEALGLGAIYGETTLPLKPEVKIRGFNSTLHRRSVQRPYNPKDDNGHRVFLGFGSCKNSGCPGDAVDVFVRAGTEVIAPFDGTAFAASQGTRYENVTLRASSQKVTALAAHIRSAVKDGQKVSVGQTIGYVGGFAGWTSHLHFELWINGKSVHHDSGTPIRKAGLGGELWSKMALILNKK